MKLSKAQERAITQAKLIIDEARAYETFEEWLGETNHYCKSHGGAEYVKANMDYYKPYVKYWKEHKAGNVLTTSGKNTIEALVKMGIFTVVEYEKNRDNGVLDWVHLNNY